MSIFNDFIITAYS